MARIKWEQRGDETRGSVKMGPEGMQRTHRAFYFAEEGFGYVVLNDNSAASQNVWPTKNQALSTFKRWAREQIEKES